ncbi:MAG TPA: FecR family protein [Thermoanaerobaculia bacterium]|nr:FecR family protein [Thermoanaerobaculia bacterium]
MDEEQDPRAEEEAVRRLLEKAGPRPPIPEEDLAAISAVARSAWQSEVRRRSRASARRPVWALAASLAAALALALGIAWWRASQSDLLPPTVFVQVEAVTGSVDLEAEAPRRIAEGDTIPIGAALRSGDGRASLRLPDGTVVRLDEDTRVRLVSAVALELERGAIYADTESGTLEVRTPLGTVRDIGTRFAVRLAEPALRVQVRHGAVAVERSGQTFVTPAGQELVLRSDGTSEKRALAGYGPEWEWVLEAAAGFDVEGRTLEEFLDWVARETGWEVRFADEELSASAKPIVLHGGLGGLRPDQAPFAVLPGAGLEGDLEGGTLVVRRLKAPR